MSYIIFSIWVTWLKNIVLSRNSELSVHRNYLFTMGDFGLTRRGIFK